MSHTLAPKQKKQNLKRPITHTLSLVRVLFEDFGVAVDIQGKRKNTLNTLPIPNTLPIQTSIFLNDGFQFEKGIILDEEYNQLEKECLNLLESLCVFGYREYYKI